MKKYLSFFRIHFINGLQYRIAAYAGIATQFAWGFMEILLFNALSRSNSTAFPMEMRQLTSYLWMRQALLGLFMSWYFDSSILDMISSGNVVYELCRPVNIYMMWFSKNLATRVSRAALRCLPILVVAFFLPKNFRMYPPDSILSLVVFIISAVVGLFITVGISMFVYGSAFYTISALGIRIILTNIIDLLSGSLIPLPFFPDSVYRILMLFPFASMQSTPFLIYSGALAGKEAVYALIVQFFWLVLICGGGYIFFRRASKRLVLQGG